MNSQRSAPSKKRETKQLNAPFCLLFLPYSLRLLLFFFPARALSRSRLKCIICTLGHCLSHTLSRRFHFNVSLPAARRYGLALRKALRLQHVKRGKQAKGGFKPRRNGGEASATESEEDDGEAAEDKGFELRADGTDVPVKSDNEDAEVAPAQAEVERDEKEYRMSSEAKTKGDSEDREEDRGSEGEYKAQDLNARLSEEGIYGEGLQGACGSKRVSDLRCTT
jgi:hypothetical protein